jgi:hypothetical protein
MYNVSPAIVAPIKIENPPIIILPTINFGFFRNSLTATNTINTLTAMNKTLIATFGEVGLKADAMYNAINSILVIIQNIRVLIKNVFIGKGLERKLLWNLEWVRKWWLCTAGSIEGFWKYWNGYEGENLA